MRGYSEDLDTLVYSTLVTGDWDPETQQGANNTRLCDVIPVVGGVLALGIHEEADGGGGPRAIRFLPLACPPGAAPNPTAASIFKSLE